MLGEELLQSEIEWIGKTQPQRPLSKDLKIMRE